MSALASQAKSRAAYRFFDHPKIGMEKLLEPHYEATIERISQEQIVLAVQDTTSLNYSTHPATVGLGPISTQPQGVVGLLLHDSMAFNLADTPLEKGRFCPMRGIPPLGKRGARGDFGDVRIFIGGLFC